MKLFYAGANYRQISEAVGLRSAQSVANVVQREMAASAGQREHEVEEAREMFLERWRQLWQANHAAAMTGDHRALAECRRLQGQWSAMFGLSRIPASSLAGAEAADDIQDGDQDAPVVVSMDELARLRAQRFGVGPGDVGKDVLGPWKVADFRN
jgi:hypothetical protein